MDYEIGLIHSFSGGHLLFEPGQDGFPAAVVAGLASLDLFFQGGFHIDDEVEHRCHAAIEQDGRFHDGVGGRRGQGSETAEPLAAVLEDQGVDQCVESGQFLRVIENNRGQGFFVCRGGFSEQFGYLLSYFWLGREAFGFGVGIVNRDA